MNFFSRILSLSLSTLTDRGLGNDLVGLCKGLVHYLTFELADLGADELDMATARIALAIMAMVHAAGNRCVQLTLETFCTPCTIWIPLFL